MKYFHHPIVVYIWLIALAGLAFFAVSCSSGTQEQKSATADAHPEKFTGPIKNVSIVSEIDSRLSEEGKEIFESKCAACHKFDERYVGPSLGGITSRRDPAWIMNMIVAPEEMTKYDPVAKQLLAEYMTQMANQNISEPDARAILEYFRVVDNNANSNL